MLKINENAEKRIIRISGARLATQADPVCTFVWCVWLPACLVGLACYRTGSGVGLLRAGSQRRYKNCQMCHLSHSWDFLWVASEIC